MKDPSDLIELIQAQDITHSDLNAQIIDLDSMKLFKIDVLEDMLEDLGKNREDNNEDNDNEQEDVEDFDLLTGESLGNNRRRSNSGTANIGIKKKSKVEKIEIAIRSSDKKLGTYKKLNNEM